MDDEDEHSPSEVNVILNIWKLLMQKLKQASQKVRRPKTILSTNRKVETQTATDMNIGSSPRYIEANGMKTGKTESLPPSELYHFLSKFA